MKHYIYRCRQCNREYSHDEIERKLIYLCPKCGKAEKNQPLEGVLIVEYDYNNITSTLTKEKFLEFPAGQFWLYPQLWPLQFRFFPDGIEFTNITDTQLSLLRLNDNSLQQINFEGKIINLLDDTGNPTLSFKDRATALVLAKAIQLKITEISTASTGNAASSLAGLASRLKLNSHVFVPSSIPDAKRVQIQAYGSNLYVVDGDYDEAFDLCVQLSNKKGWYNRNTAFNPLTIEGKKSAAFDIFISLKGLLPDIIFVPVGDGVIISGLYKGFRELLQLGWIDKLPKLVALQAAGSNALMRYLSEGKFEFIKAETVADSICAGAPRNLYMAVDAVRDSNGTALSLTDGEILSAQETLAKKYGFLVEPSAAISLAGYIKYDKSIHNLRNEKILMLITGNGLKDVSSLDIWNKKPAVKSPAQWMKLLSE